MSVHHQTPDRQKQQFLTQEDPKDDDNNARSSWGSNAEFFLSTLGYSSGIGVLTRFPYLCMQNGGGAFLIPFIVSLLAGGIPLFYIELALGQFSGRSVLSMWTRFPALQGIGYACVILSTIPYFILESLSQWMYHGEDAITHERCYDPFSSLHDQNRTFRHLASNSSSSVNASKYLLPTEDFWNTVILGINNKGIEDVGELRWQLVLSLFIAWAILFLCMLKGVQTSGKVVYVTATAPFILLTAILIRGVTLDGAMDGLRFYLTPKFTTLLDHHVWVEASLHMFYTCGPAWGALITMASYNKFKHKTLVFESIAIPGADAITAIYGGFAIFSFVGFMAKQSGESIERFMASGVGLAFVVYPQALAEMPWSPVWSILFFSMLLTLGIDTQFGFIDPLISGLLDFFPKLRRHSILLRAIIMSFSFILGLPFCTQGGIFVFALVDWYSVVVTVATVGFLEIVTVAYIYGLVRFQTDVKMMLGTTPNLFWKLLWLIVTPVFTGALLFIGLWNMRAPTHGSYIYPKWSIVVGWMIALSSFLPIPGFAIYVFLKSRQKTFLKKLTSIFSPTEEWVPADSSLVDEYRVEVKKNQEDERCFFCKETGQNSGARCESFFKCWVCSCTKSLCCSRRKDNAKDKEAIRASGGKASCRLRSLSGNTFEMH